MSEDTNRKKYVRMFALLCIICATVVSGSDDLYFGQNQDPVIEKTSPNPHHGQNFVKRFVPGKIHYKVAPATADCCAEVILSPESLDVTKILDCSKDCVHGLTINALDCTNTKPNNKTWDDVGLVLNRLNLIQGRFMMTGTNGCPFRFAALTTIKGPTAIIHYVYGTDAFLETLVSIHPTNDQCVADTMIENFFGGKNPDIVSRRFNNAVSQGQKDCQNARTTTAAPTTPAPSTIAPVIANNTQNTTKKTGTGGNAVLAANGGTQNGAQKGEECNDLPWQMGIGFPLLFSLLGNAGLVLVAFFYRRKSARATARAGSRMRNGDTVDGDSGQGDVDDKRKDRKKKNDAKIGDAKVKVAAGANGETSDAESADGTASSDVTAPGTPGSRPSPAAFANLRSRASPGAPATPGVRASPGTPATPGTLATAVSPGVRPSPAAPATSDAPKVRLLFGTPSGARPSASAPTTPADCLPGTPAPPGARPSASAHQVAAPKTPREEANQAAVNFEEEEDFAVADDYNKGKKIIDFHLGPRDAEAPKHGYATILKGATIETYGPEPRAAKSHVNLIEKAKLMKTNTAWGEPVVVSSVILIGMLYKYILRHLSNWEFKKIETIVTGEIRDNFSKLRKLVATTYIDECLKEMYKLESEPEGHEELLKRVINMVNNMSDIFGQIMHAVYILYCMPDEDTGAQVEPNIQYSITTPITARGLQVAWKHVREVAEKDFPLPVKEGKTETPIPKSVKITFDQSNRPRDVDLATTLNNCKSTRWHSLSIFIRIMVVAHLGLLQIWRAGYKAHKTALEEAETYQLITGPALEEAEIIRDLRRLLCCDYGRRGKSPEEYVAIFYRNFALSIGKLYSMFHNMNLALLVAREGVEKEGQETYLDVQFSFLEKDKQLTVKKEGKAKKEENQQK